MDPKHVPTVEVERQRRQAPVDPKHVPAVERQRRQVWPSRRGRPAHLRISTPTATHREHFAVDPSEVAA